MTRIFISYRRAGDIGLIARLEDWLSARYGSENVFRDVSKLQTAEHFDRKILDAISSSEVVIAAISDAWVGERWFRKPRIHEDGDWVRKELEHALASGTPVIPLLISDAKVPEARKLPPSLHGVFKANFGHLEDADWASDFEDVAAAIDRVAASDGHGRDDPAVWHAIEVSPPNRALIGYSALTALTLIIGAVLISSYSMPVPLGVDLDDPTTWSVAPVAGEARSKVAIGALRLALLELQASTQESGDNTGYNVSKFTKRFQERLGFANIPWSAGFSTWAYLEALKRVADSPDVALPFLDTVNTPRGRELTSGKGWLTESVSLDELRPGDFLFFEIRNRITHSAIVYTTDETRVYAISGNVQDRVVGRCYDFLIPASSLRRQFRRTPSNDDLLVQFAHREDRQAGQTDVFRT